MLGWVLQPDWGENFSEGVEQSCEKSLFAFHIHGAVIGIPDSRSFQQLLERGFQAMRLLRQRWIALASARMPGESMPSSFVTRIFMIHTPSLVEESNHPVVAIDTDQLPVPDSLGGNPESEHRRDVVLAGDDRTMGEDAADIGDQPLGL